MTIFSYHSGEQALVFPGPDGQPVGVKTRDLRDRGFKGTDDDYAKLPRFHGDREPEVAVARSMIEARAVADALEKARLQGRRR